MSDNGAHDDHMQQTTADETARPTSPVNEQAAAATAAAPAAAAAAPAAAAASPAPAAKAARAKKTKSVEDEDAAAAVAAAAAAGTSQRGRERKVTQAYVPPSPSKKRADAEEEVVEAGKGTPLGDIQAIKHHIDTTQAMEPEMKALYVACFPHMRANVAKLTIKKRIRAFSGYVLVKEHSELAEAKLNERFDAPTIKAVAHMLELPESGTKAKIVEGIIEFLREPSSSAKASSSSGSKRKSSAKAKDGKEAKPKRAATSFMLFSSANRDKIKTDNPDMDMKAIAVRLGELWRGLSDAKRAEWKAKADALKAGEEADDPEADEEEEEEEQPKAKKSKKSKESTEQLSAEWTAKFTTSIEAILKGAELSELSLAKVRQQLITEHGELVVEANKEAIKQLTLQLISKQTAKAE